MIFLFLVQSISGGFVGLFLGYSFFNIILVATDAVVVKIEKAMNDRKVHKMEQEAHEKWQHIIQDLVQKEMNKKEKNVKM